MARSFWRLTVVATTLVAVFATSAEAARRRPGSAPSSPETPEIRVSSANVVPKCVTPDRMMAFLRGENDRLDAKYSGIAADYKKHGEALRVRWDFAFYQMLLETNYLRFGHDVKPKQNNFAGLGATGHGVPGESFPDVTTGVLAQVQHLVAYSGEMVASPVAQRTRENQDGIIAQSKRLGRPVHFADLTNRWAADRNYARSIMAVAGRFTATHCAGNESEPVVTAAPETPKPGKSLARKAQDDTSVPAALGAAAAKSAATPVPNASRCQVLSASYGGNVTLLIRAEGSKGVTLTALDVEGGNEDAQAAAYIASHAQGGKVTGRFKNRTEAVNHAYGLCDSGKP